MSSLAGALIPPATNDYEYQEDVKMSPEHPITSDREDSIAGKDDDSEEMEDLFGNDVGVEEATRADDPSSGAPSRQDSERLASPERDPRQAALEYEENDEPGDVALIVREANVAFPNIPVPRSSDGKNWVIRMPNYVRVDSKPFDREYYYGPEQYEDFGQSSQMNREKSMTIKLRVENTLRWRWVKDEAGNYTKQSNSRIIRWSDGSLSLRLGKELFDINQNVDTSAAAPRAPGLQPSGSQSQSQTQSQADTSAAPELASTAQSTGQGLTYLVAQHKRAQVLQAETLVTGYMTLRPTGMQSDVHRMLARAVGQKHNKVARLRMTEDPTVDPEKAVQELVKANAKKSKKSRSEESELRKRRRQALKRRQASIWSDDDDDDVVGYAAASDEEFEGQAAYASPQRRNREEDNERAGYQEDDFLVADDSSDDGGDSRRKKKRSEEDRMEDDPLDKLEAKLQAQEEAAKRQQEAAADDTDEKMDIESEDEDDDQAVRKVGSMPGRRKRALDFGDEEEEE